MTGTLRVRIHSADFEEDTLTLQLPKDFWKTYSVRCGSVDIIVRDIGDDGIIKTEND